MSGFQRFTRALRNARKPLFELATCQCNRKQFTAGLLALTVLVTASFLTVPGRSSAQTTLAPPVGLEAYATGSGKITLYWVGAPDATGYNVYRGTTPGGQDYANPVNGETPVTTLSYPGSHYYMFTDAGLEDGVEYFYTVKAVYDGAGESEPSNEDSDIPAAGAVPWDTRDPAAILSAFRGAFSDAPPQGPLRVVGPDNSIYDDASADPQSPDGEVTPGTNQVTLQSGEVVSLPSDDPGLQLASLGQPRRERGPYRRVRTVDNYRGAVGDVVLPPAGNITINADQGDAAYIYLGMSGLAEVDAGLQYSPALQNWAAFMAIDGVRVGTEEGQIRPRVNLPQGGPRFATNQTVTLRYRAWGQYQGVRARLSLLEVDGTLQGSPEDVRALGAASPLRRAQNVRMKRVHSIGQRNLGVTRTGSSITAVSWRQGRLINPDGAEVPWGAGGITNESIAYRGDNNEATVLWVETSRFVAEDNIRIIISSP